MDPSVLGFKVDQICETVAVRWSMLWNGTVQDFESWTHDNKVSPLLTEQVHKNEVFSLACLLLSRCSAVLHCFWRNQRCNLCNFNWCFMFSSFFHSWHHEKCTSQGLFLEFLFEINCASMPFNIASKEEDCLERMKILHLIHLLFLAHSHLVIWLFPLSALLQWGLPGDNFLSQDNKWCFHSEFWDDFESSEKDAASLPLD